ncbi:MAG TPA: sigma-70 family RNA polymerase sigma factor [Actinokineospora sp.]|nr:sigma-70 family RNA polymerase sigma factor [Actinokineospora sp.]
MRDDPLVVDLVEKARAGDQGAWDQIVTRFAPLVWSVCARFRLQRADAEEVGAIVWLRLVERLGTLRRPAALPGWLATATHNECLQLLRSRKRTVVADTSAFPDLVEPPSDEWVLAQERAVSLRLAFENLPERCRRLLTLLFGDPPTPYARISTETGVAVGGIGPTRMRCLDSLRRDPGIAAWLDEEGRS